MSERAINLALRVLGLKDVERDFKSVGKTGSQAFEDIDKSAQKASGSVAKVGGTDASASLGHLGTAGKEASAGVADAGKSVDILLPKMGGLGDVAGAASGGMRLLFAAGSVAAAGIGLVAVAAASGAAELEKQTQAYDRFDAKLRATGNASGVARDEIVALVEDTRRASEQSREELLAAANELAKIPSISSAAFEAAIPVAARYADALGIDVSKQAEEMGKALSAIASGDVKEMEEALAGIDPVARNAIVALAETGRTAEAQKAYLNILSEAAGDSPGGLAAASIRLADAWSDMLARFGQTSGVTPAVAGAINGLANLLEGLGQKADNVAARVLRAIAANGIAGVGAAAGEGAARSLVSGRRAPGGLNPVGDLINLAYRNVAEVQQARQRAAAAEQVRRSLARELQLSGQTAKERARTGDYEKALVQYRKAGLPLAEAEARASKFAADSSAARARAEARGRTPRRAGGGRRRAGGGAGQAEAASNMLERAQEQAERQAESARSSADKLIGSNDEIIASYRQRAEEAQARLGKEGEALHQVERAQELEAAARRISTDLIEKEVAAARAAAVQKALESAERQKSTKLMDDEIDRIRKSTESTFDESRARADATAKIEQQRAAVRKYAAEAIDAEAAQDAFNKRMGEARDIFERTRTPIEQTADEVKRLQGLLASGALDADSFNRRMDQLAEGLVDSAEKAGNAWEGFGHDVGRTLTDIIMNGGKGRDILQKLIQLPLERLLKANVEDPIARVIDKLTGTDRKTNIAKARATLPTAAGAGLTTDPLSQSATLAAPQVEQLGTAATAAGGTITSTLEPAIQAQGAATTTLTTSVSTLTTTMGTLSAAAQAAATALSSVGASSGIGSALGTISTGSVGSLAGDVSAMIAANPGVFAEGGQVVGRGTGTSDENIIRASHGEFVVKAKAASKHMPLLMAINQDRLRSFADGGPVGPVPSVRFAAAAAAAPPLAALTPEILKQTQAVKGSAAKLDDLEKSAGKAGGALEKLPLLLGGLGLLLGGGGGGAMGIFGLLGLAAGGKGGGLGSLLGGLGSIFGGGGISAGAVSSLGGSVSSMIAANPGIFHDGGRVMPGGKSRHVTAAAALFHGAPRYHTGTMGLRMGEMPAILKMREEVLTEDEARHFRRFLRGEMPRRRETVAHGGDQHFHFPAMMLKDRRMTETAVSAAAARGQARVFKKGLAR